MPMPRVAPVLFALAAALAGCAAAPDRTPGSEASDATPAAPARSAVPATPAAPARAPNVRREDLFAAAWMQTAVEWEASARQAYRAATRQLRAVVEHRRFVQSLAPAAAMANAPAALREGRDAALARDAEFDALPPAERTRDEASEPLAVIVDVDETVLDNLAYQARLIRDDARYAEASWDAWVNERRARAVPGAVAFARYAEREGVTVFYVTNRKAHLREATIDNLRSAGFPVPADGATVLPRDDARGWTKDKGSRRRHIDATHRVVMLIGDNLGDFLDGAEDAPAARAALAAPHRDWWGERWIVLPNPAYGSWVDGLLRHCPDDLAAAGPGACVAAALRPE